MNDEPSRDIPKQSRSVSKSTGSKDSKSIKHNKNRSLEAPDMPDIAKEQELAQTVAKYKGRGVAGRRYSQRIRDRVVELAGQGMTLMDIQSIPGMPRACTIGLWKKEDPDFAEAMEEAFSDFVDQVAKQAVPKLRQALELRGLDDRLLDEAEQLVPTEVRLADGSVVPANQTDRAWREGLNQKLMFSILHGEKKARSLASTAGVILSYAERRNQYWRKDAEAVANMVVIDMSLDMDKKTYLPGTPNGQNPAALQAMRNVTPR